MKEILNVVANEKFEDIITVGFSYLEKSQIYYSPICEIIYIKFSNSYIKCTWNSQENNILLEVKNIINFDFLKFDNSSYCSSSIGKFLLKPFSYNSFINKIDIVHNKHCNSDNNHVLCIGFELGLNDYFFIDPSFNHGIIIKKEVDIIKWIEEFNLLDQSYKASFWIKGSNNFLERPLM